MVNGEELRTLRQIINLTVRFSFDTGGNYR